MTDSAPKPTRSTWIGSTGDGVAWIFGVLSLIADLYTISQMLSRAPTAPPISPWLGSLVWTLALLTYLALLHGHWERTRMEERLSASFLGYVARDLIVYYRQPFRVIPLAILTLLLFPIAYSIDQSYLFSCTLLGFVFGVIALGILRLDDSIQGRHYGAQNTGDGPPAETKKQIVDEWVTWERRIRKAFLKKNWITDSDLKDLKTVKSYGDAELVYVFALYASRHTDAVVFGDLCKREGHGESSSWKVIGENCLVQVDWLSTGRIADLYFVQ